MKTMTVKEGILRLLDGAKVTLVAPMDLDTTWVSELIELKDKGAFCVYTEDLNITEREPETYPDNDGGLYQMDNSGNVAHVEELPEKDADRKDKVDAGKIRALADADWSVQRIEEDMKISASTVRRYLKEGKA